MTHRKGEINRSYLKRKEGTEVIFSDPRQKPEDDYIVEIMPHGKTT